MPKQDKLPQPEQTVEKEKSSSVEFHEAEESEKVVARVCEERGERRRRRNAAKKKQNSRVQPQQTAYLSSEMCPG